MDAKLMETLRRITDEEQKILDGGASVDRSLYTGAKDFTIDSSRMLQKGKLQYFAWYLLGASIFTFGLWVGSLVCR